MVSPLGGSCDTLYVGSGLASVVFVGVSSYCIFRRIPSNYGTVNGVISAYLPSI